MAAHRHHIGRFRLNGIILQTDVTSTLIVARPASPTRHQVLKVTGATKIPRNVLPFHHGLFFHDDNPYVSGPVPNSFLLCDGKIRDARSNRDPPYTSGAFPPVIDCQVLCQSAVVPRIPADIHIVKGEAGRITPTARNAPAVPISRSHPA